MPFLQSAGHRLFYRECGVGPLLLILPGNTASSAQHVNDLAYWGERYHAVSIDFWGTGQSDRLAHWPVDWWAQGARDVAALIDHLGQDQALVMGTSGGGMVTLLAAIHYPDRLRAAIADSCVARWPPAAIRAAIDLRNARTPDQIAFWSGAHSDDWAQVVEADGDMLLRFGAATGGDIFGGQLGQIRCPVLITASRADSALPDVESQARWMVAQIPGAQLHLSDAGDHPFMWSNAAEFRLVAEAFLGGLKAVMAAPE